MYRITNISLCPVFFFLIIVFIYLLLDMQDLHFCEGFSLAVASGGNLQLHRLISSYRSWSFHCSSISCCPAQVLECVDFNGFGTWAQELWFPGSRAQAQQLQHLGLIAPWLVGSSWIRDRTYVSCIGRQILYH